MNVSRDRHFLTAKTAADALADGGNDVLEALIDLGGEASIRELHEATGLSVESRVQRLFEADIVAYETDEQDYGNTTVTLSHDTIHVMPIVVDGGHPPMPASIARELASFDPDVYRGVGDD